MPCHLDGHGGTCLCGRLPHRRDWPFDDEGAERHAKNPTLAFAAEHQRNIALGQHLRRGGLVLEPSMRLGVDAMA
jgi:hypothetical protein